MKNTTVFPCQRIALLVLLLGLFSLTARAQLSGTYTIDKSKAASGTNYTSFNDADSDLTYGSRANGATANGPGVSGATVFNIADGKYKEQVTIPHIAGASATNTITFQSASGDSSKVILYTTKSGTNTDYGFALHLDHACFITFNRITIKNATKQTADSYYDYTIILDAESDSNTFTNCHLVGLPYNKKYYNASAIVNGYTNMIGNGSTESYNTYRNNLITGAEFGIWVGGGLTAEIGTIIDHNTFDSTTETIYINASTGFIISNNTIHAYFGGFAIASGYTSNSYIINNFISLTCPIAANSNFAINSNGGSGFLNILNNTINIYGNQPGSYAMMLKLGYNTNVQNNIIYNQLDSASDYGIIFDTLKSEDHNVIYCKSGNLFSIKSHIYTDLNTLRSSTKYGDGDIIINPNFMSDSDLHVKNDSLNAGISLSSVTTDIDGKPRHATNPTIGASEIGNRATSCMSGTYTIGKYSSDYGTFNSAVSDLKTYGVCGPVVFNIADGTYNESVKIPAITGSSATNTITFQSASGDSNKVILNSASIDSTPMFRLSASHGYTLMIDSSSNLIFRYLTISNNATKKTYNDVIQLRGGASNITFFSNIIRGDKNNFGAMIVADDTLLQTSIRIINNQIHGGYAGVFLCDGDWDRAELGGPYNGDSNVIQNNTIDSFHTLGISAQKQRRITIDGNKIFSIFSSPFWGVGIDLNKAMYYTDSSRITNNFVTIYNGIGLNASNSDGLNVCSNSINTFNDTVSTSELFLTYKIDYNYKKINVFNNIFTNTGKSTLGESTINGSVDGHSDYNNYFSTSSTINLSNYHSNGNDSNSISVNPQFVNAAIGDLHVKNTALNFGKHIAYVSTDIDGQARRTTNPTIGADEISLSSTPPIARFSSASKACRGDSLKFKDSSTYTGTDSITTWAWNFGDGNTSSLQNPIHQYFHGGIFTTTLVVTTLSGGKDTATSSISIDSTCVWPGDINYDKVVDVHDILPIGVEYGTTGYPRPNASIKWVGQPSKDWGDTIFYGVDYKHGDCNGDSIINGSDTTAILANYSLTHYKKAGMYKGGPNDPVLSLQFSKDSFAAGDTAMVDILLGTSAVPANDVYGFAFSLNMNPKLIDTNSLTINFANTWFTPDAKYISITKQFKGDGRIDMGITRIDKIPKSGYGKIATMAIVIVDNIAGKRFVKQTLPLMFDNAQIVNEHLHDIPFSANNDSVIVYQFKTGIDENEYVNENIHVYPNPAKDQINIETKEMNILSVKISDVLGKQLSFVKINGQSNCTLSTQNLKNGVYILEINTTKGTNKMRLMIQE